VEPALTLLADCGLFLPAAHVSGLVRARESATERHLRPRLGFPLYLMLMSCFVGGPSADGRLDLLPGRRTLDLFVLRPCR